MIVGERLVELRKDKGLSQKELAALLGISANSLSLYERELRSPPDEIKIKMSELLNVSVDYLMGSTKTKNYKDNYITFSEKEFANFLSNVQEFTRYINKIIKKK